MSTDFASHNKHTRLYAGYSAAFLTYLPTNKPSKTKLNLKDIAGNGVDCTKQTNRRMLGKEIMAIDCKKCRCN